MCRHTLNSNSICKSAETFSQIYVLSFNPSQPLRLLFMQKSPRGGALLNGIAGFVFRENLHTSSVGRVWKIMTSKYSTARGSTVLMSST